MDIHFAQGRSFHLPMIVLFLGSVLLGVLMAGFLHGTLSIKKFLSNLKAAGHVKRQNQTNRKSEALLEAAENFFECGYLSKSISAYEKVLNMSPNNVNALTRLGNIVREQGDIERALELHLRAVEISPENLNSLYGLADDYCAKAIIKKEIETLEKILETDRKSPRTLYRIREVYLRLKDWTSVVDVQRKLIARIEGKQKKEKEKAMLGQYVYKKGSCYFANDNFDLAITELKKALRENRRCISAHILLGDACLRTGDKKGALKVWKKGYSSTKSTTCLVRMEKSYRDLGKIEEMIKEYKEAIKNSENKPREKLVMLLAILYLKEKNPKEAIRIIEENMAFKPAIFLSIILSDAYKQDHNEAESQKNFKSATRQIKETALSFKCGSCGKVSEDWVDCCSACNIFDTMECFPEGYSY